MGGYCYHVLNRANDRRIIFNSDGDFAAFEAVLDASLDRSGGNVELLAYCVMGNHWHLVIRTRRDGAMGDCMKWMTTTHASRHRVAHHAQGSGHLYQGRYKSFLVADDVHLLTVCRYVERNPVRAGLVERAEDWRWSSLWRWHAGDAEARAMLSPWPRPGSVAGDESRRPRNWLATVNTPMDREAVDALHTAIRRDRPYGEPHWVRRTAERHGLGSALRNRGRLPKGV